MHLLWPWASLYVDSKLETNIGNPARRRIIPPRIRQCTWTNYLSLSKHIRRRDQIQQNWHMHCIKVTGAGVFHNYSMPGKPSWISLKCENNNLFEMLFHVILSGDPPPQKKSCAITSLENCKNVFTWNQWRTVHFSWRKHGIEAISNVDFVRKACIYVSTQPIAKSPQNRLLCRSSVYYALIPDDWIHYLINFPLSHELIIPLLIGQSDPRGFVITSQLFALYPANHSVGLVLSTRMLVIFLPLLLAGSVGCDPK